MIFNSYNFLIFFPIVLLIYFIVPKKIRYIWLLIASYYFYMCWNAKYAILIGISTLITYGSGLALEKLNEVQAVVWKKKAVVALSLFSNLGILVFFKYFNFILGNINGILERFNMSIIDKPFDIILPVGISFYTFQALTYTIDLYRGEVNAEKNIFRYALFVSYFPQLTAGPIERSKNLLVQFRQMDKIKLFNVERIANGSILMIWGFFMKMVISDRVAILVDTVFNQYYRYSTFALVIGAIGFAIQIYCDFGGYSLMSIGASQIMGFDIIENFNVPYFSRSVGEFWRRWHISLSSWLRDYLYIPLGGSRCSKLKKYRNVTITFLASGIWHGAQWTYVVWGGIHAIYQIIGDITKPFKMKVVDKFKIKTECFSYKIAQVITTFILVDLAWIFFRSQTIGDAFKYIYYMFTRLDCWSLFNESIYLLGLERREINILFFAILVLCIIDLIKYRFNISLDIFLQKQNLWFRWVVIIGLIITIFIYGIYGPSYDAKEFIYSQF